jgi:hypothetical protein
MNVFDSAKPVKKAGPKAKTNSSPMVHIEGLNEFAVLNALTDTVETLAKNAKTIVYEAAAEQFISDAMLYGKRPANFRGTDIEDTEGSLELRKRSSASALNDEEKALCVKYKIPTEEVGDVIETFIFNPDMDQETMKKIAKALEGVKDLPANTIMKQVANKKTIVTDASIEAVFATKNEDTIRAMLPVVCTQAIKPVMPNFDPIKALKRVAEMLDPSKAFAFLESDKPVEEVRDVFGKAKEARTKKAQEALKKSLKDSVSA